MNSNPLPCTAPVPEPLAIFREQANPLRGRSSEDAASLDEASLHKLREWFWDELREKDVETVRKLYPLIVAGRRQQLAERRFAARQDDRALTPAEYKSEITRLLGDAIPQPEETEPNPTTHNNL